jgi:uncharacterized SAM-binding protein YcdF (DUF218 family)
VFFVLSKLLDVAFEPLTWSLAAVAIGALAWWRRRHSLSVVLVLGAVLILALAGCPALAHTLTAALEAEGRSTMQPEPYDVVVLLGGLAEGSSADVQAVRINGNAERLLATFELLRSGRAARAILSGGTAGAEVPEAQLLSSTLQRWGIEAHRLQLDDTSLNTHQNAVQVASLLRATPAHRVLVVTSAMHVPRAQGCLRKEGVVADVLAVDHRVGPAPAVYWPRASALDMTTSALREWAGRWLYRVWGYV